MRSSRKLLFTALLCILLTLTAAFISACADAKVKLTFMDGSTVYQTFEGEAGTQITPPEDPKRDGYRFSGWYLDENFSGEPQALPTQMPEVDTTYYAHWTEKVSVILSLDAGEGGMLTEREVHVSVGDNVLEAVAGIVPTVNAEYRGVLTFGGWFNGATQVTADAVVPTGGMTLTAKYKITYTVKIYVEGDNGAYSERFASERGSAWYKEAFEYEIDERAYPHYILDRAHEGFAGDAESLDETNNVFTVYLKRERLTVMYDGNVGPQSDAERPSGVTGHVDGQEVVYGLEVILAKNRFVPEGAFRFAGWSRTPNGTAEYQPGERIAVVEHMLLYAVWDRGYTDRFGGADVIYFPKSESGVALLVRAGMEFRGETSGDGSFTFNIKEGSTGEGDTVTGQVEGSTFLYRRENIEGTYTLYDSYLKLDAGTSEPSAEFAPNGLDPSVTLTLDSSHATLRAKSTISGAYGYDRALGLYYIEDGKGGKARYFSLGKSEGDSSASDAGKGEDIFYLVEPEAMGVFPERQWRGIDGSFARGRSVLTLSGNGRLTLQDEYTGETYSGYYASATHGIYVQTAGVEADFYSAVYFRDDNEAVPFKFYVAREAQEDGSVQTFFTARIEGAVGAFTGTIGGQPATIKLNGFNGFDYGALDIGHPESGDFVTIGEGSAAKTYSIYDVDGSGRFADYLIRVTDVTSFTVLTFKLPKGAVGSPAANAFDVYTVRLFREGDALKFETFHDGEYEWLIYREGDAESGIGGGDCAMPILLVLSEDAYQGKHATAASVYVLDADTGEYREASAGYVTQAEGDYGFRTYTHAGSEAPNPAEVFFRETFGFRTLPATENARGSYLVYAIDGAPLYTAVQDAEGNELLIYLHVRERRGAGSFYKSKEGTMTEGSLELLAELPKDTGVSALFSFTVTGSRPAVRYFNVACGAAGSGGPEAEFISFAEFGGPNVLEAVEYRESYLVMTEEGSEHRHLPTLTYDSVSERWEYTVYHVVDGIVDLERRPATVKGTLAKDVKTTPLGYDIYTFTPDPNGSGVKPFSFSPWELEQGDPTVHMLGRAMGTWETIASQGGDSIELDGYAGATLKTADGETYSGRYFLQTLTLAPDVERQAINFTAETGEAFRLIRSGDAFYFPDALFCADYCGVFDASKTGAGQMPYGDIGIRCLGDGTAVVSTENGTSYECVGEGTYTYGKDSAGYPLLTMELRFYANAAGGARRVTFMARVKTVSQEREGLYLVGEEVLSTAAWYSEEDWSVLTFGNAIGVGERSDAVYCDPLGYLYHGTVVKIDATHGIFLFDPDELGGGEGSRAPFLYFTFDEAKGTFAISSGTSA